MALGAQAALASETGPESLAEAAYRVLEEQLVSLRLAPGALVSEGELIELTGIGRTPVREAIQRLASQDLFQVLPRKGLLVSPVSRAGMLHILETRKPLERLVVHRAALNARDEQRSGLAAIARELAAVHDRFDLFLQLDRQLGDLLDNCAGNPFAAGALAPLRSHSRRCWQFHRPQVKLADAISPLAQLSRLVARRDVNGAQKASDTAIAVLERLVNDVDRMS